jgi:hypothetical protein
MVTIIIIIVIVLAVLVYIFKGPNLKGGGPDGSDPQGPYFSDGGGGGGAGMG